MKARRLFIGLTFALNILLGNLCLLNIGYAATPAGSSDLEPVSREVYECPWIAMNKEISPVHPVESPCESGHCIAKPKPQTSCVVAAVQMITAPALPVEIIDDLPPALPSDIPLPEPTDSPPDPGHIRTIVLRR